MRTEVDHARRTRNILSTIVARAGKVEPMPEGRPRIAILPGRPPLMRAAFGGQITMEVWRHLCGDLSDALRGEHFRGALVDLTGCPAPRLTWPQLADGCGLLGLKHRLAARNPEHRVAFVVRWGGRFIDSFVLSQIGSGFSGGMRQVNFFEDARTGDALLWLGGWAKDAAPNGLAVGKRAQ